MKILESLYPIYSLHPSGFKTLNLLQHLEEANVILFLLDIENGKIIEEEVNSFSGFKAHTFDENIENKITSSQRNLIIVKDRQELSYVKEILSTLTFFKIKQGEDLNLSYVLDLLSEKNFERTNIVENPGEFAVRGGILDIYLHGGSEPLRLEFSGNKVLSIRIFDPETQRSVKPLSEVTLFGIKGKSKSDTNFKVIEEIEGNSPFHVLHNFNYLGNLELLRSEIDRLKKEGYKVYFFSFGENKEKFFEELLKCQILRGKIYNGFIFPVEKIAVFTETELRGIKHRRWIRREHYGEKIEDYTDLKVGDYLVHLDFGIGRFAGLERIEIENIKYDTIRIEYKDGVVNIPVHNFSKVEKYIGEEGEKIEISALASPRWQVKRAKALLETYKFAMELLKIHSYRKKERGFIYKPVPELEYKLYAEFPYEETEGQIRVMEEIFEDMESPKIMDRLVAGEVGFGKTEIALRTAFRAAVNSFQTILLVPTTLLALQHYTNFTKRLANYPVKVAMLSRLTHPKEKDEILKGLAEGKIDIVIGTHALLRSDISFFNLGLLIIDEEHRFGVEDKELIRQKFPMVDTLRLTATPIPRTLYMSLGKIYDLSILDTPPPGREAVETYVGKFDREIIKQAIQFEIERDGKVFFVNNRISGMKEIVKMLEEMFPDLRIGYAHGRMPKNVLEDIYINFYLGAYDILVSTPIIEAGVDFPEANTIIINNAHTFGLADLHQLRGRVGRGIKKGYAYFLTPSEISEEAKKRLSIIEKYSELGSGFKIAMKDLELRGAGEILGKKQHGFVRTIGLEMFFRLLEQAILELEGQKFAEKDIKVKTEAYIPYNYIENESIRLSFYKKLADAKTEEQLQKLREELLDRFGPIPPEVEELFYVQRIKILAASKESVKGVVIGPSELIFETDEGTKKFKRGLDIEFLRKWA
uniref:Transcription-repair-coupling factor n=1 Tax=candidate division WOR-3 bacterium TaxID=2052148 RepID=A0A7C2PD54_UNCW3